MFQPRKQHTRGETTLSNKQLLGSETREPGSRNRALGKTLFSVRRALSPVLVFSLLLVLLPVALAQPAKLELNGKAKIERSDKTEQSYSRSGGTALTLNLGPGDRICVTEGNGKLIYGVKAYALQSPGTACFEVARPKSLWQNLVQSCQDIGVCKKEAEKAFVKEAKSRGLGGETPLLYLPGDFSLPALKLTIAGGQTLRLLDAKGKEIQRLEAPDGTFSIPVESLKNAARLEVQNQSGVAVYGAPLRWVNIEGQGASGPREQALALWLSQNISYAPAAYSYLLAAGDSELAQTLEAQIRAEFRGVAR